MKGSVILVGAGCGRDLITLRGLTEVKTADTIVYDDLLDMDLLYQAKDGCEFIYVGKRAGAHSRSQEEINEILIEKAKDNKKVVRLKGGDGFVFGRGGDELMALREAGIPSAVIPGVSSAIAVPEHLGIPITQRSIAQSLTVVTGHSATEKEENYQALADLDGTLVFLMGLTRITEICGKLLECGKHPETPATVISCGFLPGQKRVTGTLYDIAEKAADMETPAVLVIGPTAAFELTSTIDAPLNGKSVTVTGTRSFTGKMAGKLKAIGAYVQQIPVIRITPDAHDIVKRLKEFQWLIFTSANGVEIFFEYLHEAQIDMRKLSTLKYACIGSGTAGQLKEHGIYADFIPSEYTAEILGRELPPVLEEGEKVLILRAENGSEDLTQELEEAGVIYEDLPIYHAQEEENLPTDQFLKTDYIIFASASGVRASHDLGIRMPQATAVCIGRSTANAFYSEYGRDCIVPSEHTAEGMIEIILEDSYRVQLREAVHAEAAGAEKEKSLSGEETEA